MLVEHPSVAFVDAVNIQEQRPGNYAALVELNIGGDEPRASPIDLNDAFGGPCFIEFSSTFHFWKGYDVDIETVRNSFDRPNGDTICEQSFNQVDAMPASVLVKNAPKYVNRIPRIELALPGQIRGIDDYVGIGGTLNVKKCVGISGRPVSRMRRRRQIVGLIERHHQLS